MAIQKRVELPEEVSSTTVTETKVKRAAPSGVSVVSTFFEKVKNKIVPGVGNTGLVLDHRNYVKDTDSDGNALPVEFRWGSARTGQAEKNMRGAFVQALVNPETMELDPAGKPVTIGGSKGAGMTLLVRQKEWGDKRRAFKEELAYRAMKKQHRAQVEEAIEDFGLTKNVHLEETEEDTSTPFTEDARDVAFRDGK